MATSFVAGGGIQSESISEFDPRTLSGCVLWLDAADSNTLYSESTGTFPSATGTTLAAVGSNVVLWSDKSGQTNNATRNTDSSFASFTLNTGIPGTMITNGIRFGNLGSFRLDPSKVPIGTSPITLFIVSKSFDATTRHSLIHIGDNSASARFVQINKSVTEGVLFGNNNSGNYPHSGAFNTTQTFITTGLISGGSSTSNNFIIGGWSNGTPFSTNNNFDGTSLNLSVSNAYVGIGAAAHGYKGDMNEILIFNRALQNDERQQVEGYLAWKWGVVQNLPITHPYYYAKAPQTAFQPTNFPSCALWLDAADRNTVSAAVTQWNDKSGNGRHFVAAGSSPTPTFSNSAFLGRPGIQFTRTVNTSRTVLQWTNNAAPLVTSDITVMMLVRRTAANTSQDRLLSATSTLNSEDSDKADSFGFVNRFGSNSIIHRNGRNTDTTPPVDNIGTGASQIITMTINRSTLTSTIRKTISTGTTTGLRTGEPDSNLSLKQIRLGTITEKQEGTSDGGLFTFQGVFSEVLIYNSVLTTTQLNNLEGYLAWKYQLATTLLPSSHQYYTASPVGIVPTNITGCQLWLDASDVSSMNLSLTQWNDKSGNGRNAAQSTIANQPTFSSSAVNFGDVNRFMSFSNLSILNGAPCAGLFSVLSIGSAQTAASRASLFRATNADGFARFAATISDASQNRRPGIVTRNFDGSASSTSIDASADAYANDNTVFSLFHEANYSAQTLNIFRNGTNIAAATGVFGSIVSIPNTNSTAITLSMSTTSEAMNNANVRELILFTGSALTTAQRQQVEGYLAWKWGLQGNLPSTHPFTQANYFFNNTRPLTRYFNPPDIDGCQLWLDAADQSTLFSDTAGTNLAVIGNAVARWDDKSGLGNNATNASSSVRYSTTLNSRSVLSFPSTGTVAGNTLSTPSLTRDPVNFSAFYVCRYPLTGSYAVQAISSGLDTTTTTTITNGSNAATTVLTVNDTAGFVVGYPVVITSAGTATFNQTGIITEIASSTSMSVQLSNGSPGGTTSSGTITQLKSNQSFGHDGVSAAFNVKYNNYDGGIRQSVCPTVSFPFSSYPATPPTTLADSTFLLGCVRRNDVYTFSTNGVFNNTISGTQLTTGGHIATGHLTSGGYSIFGGVQGMDIGEVIVYNSALTEYERQEVEGYLVWKWGLQRARPSTNPKVSSTGIQFPSTHPYYNFPTVQNTAILPSSKLYKKPFDPSDLSPDLWLDGQDLSTMGVDSADNRIVQWTSKGTATTPAFSIPSYLGSSAGLTGPLLSTSKLGSGANMNYLDFSPGGSFPIVSAEITSATNMRLTLGYPSKSYNTNNGKIEAYSINVSSGTSTATTVTINFTSNTTNVPPFPVGSFVTFASTSNTGTPNLNDNVYTVATARPTQITITTSGTTGTITGGTISPSSTSPSVTAQNLATVYYATDDKQPFVAGQRINLSGGTFNALSDIRIINATPTSIQFLTTIATAASITNGTIALVNPPHGIPANRQVTVAFASAQYADGSDATPLGGTYDGSTALSCTFSGTISSTTLTVESVTLGFITAGMTLTGSGITGSVMTSVQTSATTWTITNPNSNSISTAVTITGAISHFPPVGTGTPYIVATQSTNTIDITLPYTIAAARQGVFKYILGSVSYGTIHPQSITVPASAGASTITTLTAHGLSNGDNINLNFIALSPTPLSGVSISPTNNPIYLNGYYAVSGITESTLNRFQITLAIQTQGGAGTFTYTGGTTSLLVPSGQGTSCTISFPVNGYCLERQSGVGLSSDNATVIIVAHNISPPTRTGIFSSIQPVMFGTAQTLNNSAGADQNSGPNAFVGIGRDFAVRLAAFAGTAQRISLKKNNANSLPMFTGNANRSLTDNGSGFRIITTCLNTSGTASQDIPAFTNTITLNGWRNELAFYNLNSGNQMTTSFRILAIQTNGTNSMTIVYSGFMVAGQNPFQANSNFTISGFSTAGFNNAYTSVTSTTAAVLSSNPYYGSITVTASTPAISTLPASGTYVPTDGVGIIHPTNRTTTLSTAQIRIGSDTRAKTGTGSGGIAGADAGLSNYCYDGGISEILVFSSILSVEQRQLLEGYLAQKYNSLSNKPVGFNYLGSSALALSNATSTTIAIGGATCAGTGTTIGGASLFLVTLTHSAGIHYAQGPTITVSGITPSGYNGTWTVVHSTPTTVQYFVGSALTTSTVAGSITAGTGQTNTFVHPYFTNPAITTGQNTLDLASATSTYAQNLVAWYDAANINSLIPTDSAQTPGSIVDSNSVYSWANLGGSLGTDANLIQSTSLQQPTFKTNITNGLPGIQFVSGNNADITASVSITQRRLSTYSTNNELTIFVVYRHTTVTGGQYILNISNSSNTRVALQTGAWNINQLGASAGPNSQFTTTFNPANNTPYMNVMRRSGSNMTNRITGNGTQIKKSDSFTNLALTGTFDQICIGHYRTADTTPGQQFIGYVHEVAIFRSALSDQAIQQVEGYLAWKWGLQASLPDNHAYKRLPA